MRVGWRKREPARLVPPFENVRRAKAVGADDQTRGLVASIDGLRSAVR